MGKFAAGAWVNSQTFPTTNVAPGNWPILFGKWGVLSDPLGSVSFGFSVK